MLLPSEFIENSIETYIYNHPTKSQKIYWIVLLAVTAALVSLPFVYVDISVQNSGVVRSVTEKMGIKSPVSSEFVDSVDSFSEIYQRNSVKASGASAIISLGSGLYFEIYVTPRNIGYLSVGMPVNVQVESFNYNEWGMVAGKITEISSDFFTDSQAKNSYYKVKCNMEKDFLMLRSGKKGKLKKGMLVNAHFMITRRSLFDLLFQKMDDWINPAQYNNKVGNEKNRGSDL